MPDVTFSPMCSEAFGAIEFAAPLAVWGAVAAGVPVLIHLVLRPRTRRQVLPTMRFLLQAHHHTSRTHRLKRLLLLLCRVAVVLLLVGILMRPSHQPEAAKASAGPTRPADVPVSAVIAFDNSASMGYRFQGQTRLMRALGHARALLDDTSRFPPGSQVAIVSGPPRNIPSTWMEPSAAQRFLNRLAPEDHDVSAARLLEQGYATLRHARHPVRELYLLSDLTRHAWSGGVPAAPAELSGIYILDVGQTGSPNVSLSWPRTPASFVPASRPSELTLSVTAAGQRVENHQLSLDVDDQRRATQVLAPLDAGSQVEVTVQVPPLESGAHRITLRLEPGDALACDDRRFAVVSCGSTPGILLVGDERASDVPVLVRAMIAPPAQPARTHRFPLTPVNAGTWDGRVPADVFAVLLADVPAVSGIQGQGLEAFVKAGGCVVVVPGPAVASAGYAGLAILPAAILGTESLDPPLGLGAGDLGHVYLRPFAAEDVDSINMPRAYRRLRVGPLLPGSRLIAPFSDGQPAILERSVGSGRALLLTFSPQREWGQYGTQAAPLLVLLQTILGEWAPRAEGTGSYAAGQGVFFPLTQQAASEFFLRGGVHAQTIAAEASRVAVPTTTAGAYQLCRDAGCREALLTYSVNVRESESDLTRITDDELMSRLPPGRTRILHDPAVLREEGGGPLAGVGLLVPVALALAGLMYAESLFSNRFYGKRGTSALAPDPGREPAPVAEKAG